ncbi:hypothetical protein ACX1HO_21990 [Yersinia enterocolitica]|nr:hypothetical protein [Yersinia enterocolitica]
MPSINNATISVNAINYSGTDSSVNSESELIKLEAQDSMFHATSNIEHSLFKNDESPTSLSSDKTLLFDKYTSDKNRGSKDLKEKKEISSNSISNDKKAVGHIVTLSLASLIGIVLAPFTGGISLLPTAFVVLFGNSSALAMYGGSKFFLDDTKEEIIDKNKSSNQPSELESHPIDGNALPHTHGVQYPQPDNLYIDHSKELDRDIPKNVGEKSDRIIQDAIDEQVNTEDENSEPAASIADVIEKFGNISVIECRETEEEIDQFDFISKFSQLPESEVITNFLEQQPVLEQIAHLDNEMIVYIGRIVPHHIEKDNSLTLPESLKPMLKTMSTPAEAKQWPKVEISPAIKTTQGATSGRGDNHTAGVRHNSEVLQSEADFAPDWPTVNVLSGVRTSQGPMLGRSDNDNSGAMKNINAENHDAETQATGQATAAERSSPYTKGVEHQLLDIEALKKTVLSQQDNLGIENKTNLRFLHRSDDKTRIVAVAKINLNKLAYSSS